MKKKSIAINAVLNVIKQCLSVIFPLITYPYALRVLGTEGIGRVNYSSSVIHYFALIATLGLSSYAAREGAKVRGEQTRFNEFVNEVFSINILTTLFSYLMLGIVIIFVPQFGPYRYLLLLHSVSMLFTSLGVEYINIVYEDFALITIRTIVIHIVSAVMLFVLVHSPKDYYLYALISVVSSGIVCVLNMFYCRKYARVKFTFRCNFKKHIKPMLIMFANTLAISIYVNVDITMIGWIKGNNDVGLYTASVKIYTVLKQILGAIYAVSIPRLASYMGSDDEEEFKKLGTDIMGYLILLILPAGVGVICMAPEIIAFMGGSDYSDSTLSLRILGGSLGFATLGGFVTSCINIPMGREKENLFATIISAILNVGLNLIVIPRYSYNGAAFTTFVSEVFVFVFCFIRLPDKKRLFDFVGIRKVILDSGIGILFVVLISVLARIIIRNDFIRLAAAILISVPVYFGILFLLKDPYVKEVIRSVGNKMRIV